ncbi:hypothetical protein TCAL_07939 [Tigriopus californicus]|uniref:PDEase domain-containing protein n=1 Tax=Tigriopus californicus TaxID=6832 RepID=A0A553NFN9_TIGCA|nr:uncharacterized protein LOC131887972 [Tigriopus californicus]TRY64257.1 hypothetical protein TCAL_07939 [Tigriopus californicus]|eukprot:TCALIF_07939-PA protein Name:"Similar to Pde7b cAMP-specific 3',5'-cyclic phosphodiesterase 7B (Mus musculus)" AED:0.00 eAED:0.00 QI:87/1/1/1/1/1/2/788/884
MASQGNIGRLPIGPAAITNTFSEDDELELLELQLLTTQVSARHTLTSARFTPKDQGSSATFPRKAKDRKSLMTLWSDRGLLDEVQLEQIQRILLNINHWDFNAFTLDRFTCGNNLATLCVHLFKEHGLLQYFKLDTLVVWKFFTLVEQGYYSTNPYHNAVHAADVTQAINCFLEEPSIKKFLTPLELMSALVAAVCHDLDHPGRNEKFLIATSSHLAGMYNNSSVLENHHWRMTMSICADSGLSDCLSKSDLEAMDDMVRDIILATDISRQAEFLSKLRDKLDRNALDFTAPEERLFIIQIAMKCADISNPCRSWNISRLWSYRASEEFFRQGDCERMLDIPVTPFCDRFNITVAKVQSGFYRFVAFPLFEEWHRFLSSPLSLMMVRNLTTNQARWDLIVQQETNRGSMMDSTHSTSSSSTSCSHPNDSRRESLDPPQSHLSRMSRSSADDEDSDPCTSYPYMPLDNDLENTNRRHSLPLSDRSLKCQSKAGSEDSADDAPSIQSNFRHPPHLGGERRRIVRQPDINNYHLANKRRLFATSHSPPGTFTSKPYGNSLDSHMESSSNNRVTFSFGPREEDEEEEEREDDFDNGNLNVATQADNKENLNIRRGSAPGSLLLHQFANLSFNKSISREASPTGPLQARNRPQSGNAALSTYVNKLSLNHRRGSLPCDFLEQTPADALDNHRSSSCGRYACDKDLNMRNGNQANPLQKRILRQRSGDSNLNYANISSSSSSPHCLNELGATPCFNMHQIRMARRGSLRSGGSNASSSNHLSARRGSAPIGTQLAEDNALQSLPHLQALTLKGKKSMNSQPIVSKKCGLQSNVEYLRNMESMARAQVLRNSHLSPSVENEFLEDMQAIYAATHGRRGSLPTEYTMTSTVQ